MNFKTNQGVKLGASAVSSNLKHMMVDSIFGQRKNPLNNIKNEKMEPKCRRTFPD